MKILISGATGLVGEGLVLDLIKKGHEVRILTRSPKKAQSLPVKAYFWNAVDQIDESAFEGIDALIHLAGESISKLPWTKSQKQKILNSRVQGTTLIKNTLNKCCNTSVKVVSASAVGIYGNQNQDLLSEQAQLGEGFLASVVKAWEASWDGLESRHSLCVLRLGIVISRRGGFLNLFEKLFRQGVGGPIGGSQYLPWVAIDDVINVFSKSATENGFSGTYNLTAENPVTQAEFCKKLAQRLNIWSLPAIPKFLVAPLIGDMKELLLYSQNAVPEKLKEQAYEFKFSHLEDCFDAEFPMGSCRTFNAIQWVPHPIGEVFEFFSSEKNLEKITPKSLKFKVLSSSTEKIEQGTEIKYKLKIHGVPARWTTTIAVWNPPHEFIDDQKSGPYKKWHHMHRFEPMAGGTLLYDEVHFKLPFGKLGDITAGLLVERDVKAIFAHRKKVISKTF